MITLTLLGSDFEHQQWQFEQCIRIKVGRAPDNDVLLAHEQVSRYHLELSPNHPGSSDGEWKVQGLGTNGTLVNGKFITQGDLSNGDLIQLGLTGPLLKFELTPKNPLLVSDKEVAGLVSPASDDGPDSSVICMHENNEPDNQFCIHCGASLHGLEKLGHYQVVQTFDSQKREVSFLVRDIRTGGTLSVLRRFRPEIFSQAQDRFEQEVQWLGALNNQGLARVIDSFCEDPYRYVVLERALGLTLEEWVLQEEPNVSMAIKIVLAICTSLSFLHSHNPPIIHGNLALKNILIRQQGQGAEGVILINFGSLRAAGLGLSTSASITVQSDLYRLGTVLIYMLTGSNPNQYFNVQRLSQHIKWTAIPQVPSSLHSIIERMTHPDLQYRYGTVEEITRVLRDYQQQFS